MILHGTFALRYCCKGRELECRADAAHSLIADSSLVYIHPMPTYPHIEQYRERLQELKEFGGSDNELSIRPAFQNCLDAYCREHREKLALVPELTTSHCMNLSRLES